MELGILLAALAMIGWGISNGITRTPALRIGVIQTLFYRNLVVLLFLVPAAFLFSSIDRITAPGVLSALGLSVVGYASLLLLFKGQKTGKIGVVNPIASACSSLVILLIGGMFYGQTLTGWQTVAVILVIVGVLLGTFSFSDFKASALFRRDSGILYALATGVCWGTMFGFMIAPTRQIGIWWTVLILNLGNLIFSLIHLPMVNQRLVMPDRISLGATLVGGFGGALAIAAYNAAVTMIPIAMAGAISGASPLIAIVIGMFAYKERHSTQSLLGMLLAIVGVVLISLTR